MPRAIWSGAISFGLVNVPVKLFSATSHKEVSFHQLHKQDGARIKYQRVCSADGEEVPYEDIVKGYELGPGRYVMLEKQELAALNPVADRTIAIEDFVEEAEIDPIFYESAYYLAPDKGALRAYRLLLEAMRRTGKVGIARVVLRTRQYLCAVRPLGEALALSTMLYADEVVAQSDLAELPSGKEGELKERELEMAQQLIESLTSTFEPDKYKDQHREDVLRLIERKAEGEEIVAPQAPAEPARVVNLMDALSASLKALGDKPAAGKAEAKGRAPARTGGTKTVKSRAAAKTSKKRKSA